MNVLNRWWFMGLWISLLGVVCLLSGCGAHESDVKPETVDSELGKAVALLDAGASEDARNLLQSIVTRFPSNAVAQLNLGVAYERTGDLLKADDAFMEAAALNPADALALELAARVHMQIEDWDGARRLLDQANRRKEYSPRILTAMGVVEYRTGHFDTAQAFFNAALKADETYASAHYNAAVLQRDGLQNLSAARSQFKAYLQYAPDDDAHVAEAREFLRSVDDSIVPDDPLIAEPQEDSDRDVAPEVPVEAALQSAPVADTNVVREVKQEEPASSPSPVVSQAAETRQTPAAKDNPLDTPARRLWERAINAHHQQDTARAVALYKAALDLDPTLFGAWHNLGLAAKREGDLVTAQRAFEQALTLRPDWPDSLFMLALVLHQQDQDERATALLDTLLALEPKHVKANYLLAVIYANAGRRGMARAHFEHVLRLDGTGKYGMQAREWLEKNRRRPPPEPAR